MGETAELSSWLPIQVLAWPQSLSPEVPGGQGEGLEGGALGTELAAFADFAFSPTGGLTAP